MNIRPSLLFNVFTNNQRQRQGQATGATRNARQSLPSATGIQSLLDMVEFWRKSKCFNTKKKTKNIWTSDLLYTFDIENLKPIS